MTPKISVLMPVYNAEKYVSLAVDSILNQTFLDFEFIVINDGSTDGTLDILQRYAQQDSRIRLISRENKGLVATLNEGLALAKAPLIARMDADDIALPERFSKQYKYLNKNTEVVLVGGRCVAIDSCGDSMALWNQLTSFDDIQDQHLNSLNGSAVAHPSMMFRKEVVQAVGGYLAESYPAEDLDLLLRVSDEGSIENLEDVILKYRVHAGSICANDKQKQNNQVYKIVNKARERKNLKPMVKANADLQVAAQSVVSGFLMRGWWSLNAGYKKTAWKYACRSVMAAPLNLDVWRFVFCVVRGR